MLSEHLGLHLAFIEGTCKLQEPVSQRAFTVVDVCYYAKIADVFHTPCRSSKLGLQK